MRALIFDLDGTLIDSVYAHTSAWQKTFADAGLSVPAYSIHRRIGMSGELLVKAVARGCGRTLRMNEIKRLEVKHAARMHEIAPVCSPLPGARELLGYLKKANIAHGIATSGKQAEFKKSLKALSLSSSAVVVDGDMVKQVKPEPDLFTTRARCAFTGTRRSCSPILTSWESSRAESPSCGPAEWYRALRVLVAIRCTAAPGGLASL